MMQIAIVSDIHGNLPALEAVVHDLTRRGIDTVINLGDHLSGPLWPSETARFLMAQPWLHVAGNHDRQLTQVPIEDQIPSDRFAYQNLGPEPLAWLDNLPAVLPLESEILAFHGAPADLNQYLLETVAHGQANLADPSTIRQRLAGRTAPILLCGHSHLPRVVRLEDAALIVNPGSVGLQAYDDRCPEPHVIETGSPDARYAVLTRPAGLWQVDLVAVPYDHPAASAQATRNGRPDWAAALRTGFFGG